MMQLLLAILLIVPSLTLDEVEVTATRPQVQSEAFRLVAQVSHDELTRMPVTTIADVLAYLPGVDVRARGTNTTQTDISLRGGTFDQVLVLLNGIPLQDTQTGHYAMNIPLNINLIERIELLQGTAANLTDAFTGAINIVTKDVSDDRYHLSLSAGTNGDVAPSFIGSWRRGDARVHAAVDYARSDGYYAPQANEKERSALRNTDYQLANIYLQTRWRDLDIQAGAQYKDVGLGTGYGYASTDQFDATRTMFASARYNGAVSPNWRLTASMAYRGQYDRYEWHRGTALNRHWTHNAQTALQAHYTSSIGRTTIGAALKSDYIRSTNMGEHHRWQATLNAEQQFVWRGLAASVGVAGHYNAWCGWYASGAASLGYSFLQTGTVYMAAGRSLRMPTWTDLYYKAGVQRGSTSLQAEKAWSLSLGAQYTWRFPDAGQLHLSADTYYRWGQDIIDWTYNEADSLFYATNQNAVDAFGIDFVAHYRYNAWLRNLSVRYAYTHLSLDLTNTKSHYLDHLRHKFTATIDHGIYVWSKGCVGADWSLRWQDRAGTYVDIYGKAGNPFQPVLLLDGAVYVEINHLRVALECQNLTNRHYYDYGGILMPGAHGRINLRADF